MQQIPKVYISLDWVTKQRLLAYFKSLCQLTKEQHQSITRGSMSPLQKYCEMGGWGGILLISLP